MAVIRNGDGRIFNADSIGTNVGTYRAAKANWNFADDGGAMGVYPIFTVTGDVYIQQIYGACRTALTSGGVATIELGTPTNTAAFIAQTTATELDQYELWQDAGPEANPGKLVLLGRTWVLQNGADIVLTINTAALTAGNVDLYCNWIPLSKDGNVSAGRNVISETYYFLRDEFTSALAAGSVNGTSAEPGPGTRTVVDTDSKLTIGSGNLNLAPHSVVATGDPGYWLDAVTRTAGRLMLCENQRAATNTYSIVGFDINQSGTVNEHGLVWATDGNFKLLDGGAGGPALGSQVAATDYVQCVVLRSTGAYYLIKGGVYTNWTLLWQAITRNTATVYPGVVTNSATVTTGYIRVPAATWLPTPIAYDTFTRANGALGNTEPTGPDSQSTPVRAWTNQVGTTQIATNAASASALVGGLAIATADTLTTNVVASGTLSRSGNEVGIIVRYADSDNYIRAIHDGTNCKLIKRVATVESDVISAAVALGAGAIVVIADGTSFSLFLNNAKVGSTSTISDAGLQTGTAQGLFSTNTGNTQDNFQVFPRGGGAYSRLDDF